MLALKEKEAPKRTRRQKRSRPAQGPQWSILSPQGRVLFYLAVCPDSGIKQIARALDLTERATWGLIRVLRQRDMLRLRSDGRRHHYSVNLDAPLLLPTNDHTLTLRPVMKEIMKEAKREPIATCAEIAREL